MNIATLSCTSCGAPIQVSNETDHINCKYCGSALVVKREAGQVSLKLAEKVSRSIQETGLQTQSTIREGTYATQAELKKLQLSQELSSVDMQLANLRAEIRALQRLKADRKIKRELKELKGQEMNLVARQNDLRNLLAASTAVAAGAIAAKSPASPPAGKPAQVKTKPVAPENYQPKQWSTTFWLAVFFGIFGVHRFYTGNTVIGLLQLFTLGGFLIWWMLDILWLIVNGYHDKFGKQLSNYSSKLSRASRIGFLTYIVASFALIASGLGPDYGIFIALALGAIAFAIANFWSGKIKLPAKKSSQIAGLPQGVADQALAQIEENQLTGKSSASEEV